MHRNRFLQRLRLLVVPFVILVMFAVLLLVLSSRSSSDYDLPELYTISSNKVISYGDKLIKQLRADLDRIGSNPEPATFENTILPLDAIMHKFYTAKYSCSAHVWGASDASRASVYVKLSDPALMRNTKLYQRICSVLETLPVESEDQRFAKACESLLRLNGASLNATALATFDRLEKQIQNTRTSYSTCDSSREAGLVARLISDLSQQVQLISPYDDLASLAIAESCAGSVLEVESLLASMSSMFSNLDLTQFHRALGFSSPTSTHFRWDTYTTLLNWRLATLNERRWKLDDVFWKGIFFTANKLYGLQTVERFDIHKLHADVRVFEFFEESGSKLGLVFLDLKKRKAKDAEDSAAPLLERSRHLKLERSAVLIMMNIPEQEDQITFTEVVTLFHEFGHALHMLFSNPKYSLLSAVHSPLDWVEFPSQLHEMWAHDPDVLRNMDPGLTDFQISQIQNEFALSDALKKFQDLLTGIAAFHWTHLTTAPRNIQSFIQDLQNRYGLTFVSPPEMFLTPRILLEPYSLSVPLLYGYSFSWRIARSAQEWVKANGGLCRQAGEEIRKEALSKGWSAPWQNMTELFHDHRNVTLHADLTLLSSRLSPIISAAM